jgi:hypothetical protein
MLQHLIIVVDGVELVIIMAIITMNITVIITSQILKSKKIMRWKGKRLKNKPFKA